MACGGWFLCVWGDWLCASTFPFPASAQHLLQLRMINLESLIVSMSLKVMKGSWLWSSRMAVSGVMGLSTRELQPNACAML